MPAHQRPALVIGFAAETENVIAGAQKKWQSKGADAIIANIVNSCDSVFGADVNEVYVIDQKYKDGLKWPKASKNEIAAKLAAYCVQALNINNNKNGSEHAA